MYYHNIWDPLLIISQISLLQCCFYIIFGTMLLVQHILFTVPLSLNSLLNGDALTFSDRTGWPAVLALLLTSLLSSYTLLIVVGRAKKCLDFTATLYFLHYLLCLAYHGIPLSWQYYGVIVVALLVTVLMGEYLCMKEEMKWIPTSNASSPPPQPTAHSALQSLASSLSAAATPSNMLASASKSSMNGVSEIELSSASRSRDSAIDIEDDDAEVAERVGLISQTNSTLGEERSKRPARIKPI